MSVAIWRYYFRNKTTRFAQLSLIVTLIIVISCSCFSSGKSKPTTVLSDGSNKPLLQEEIMFVNSLKKAVKDRDLVWLASNIDFPLKVKAPNKGYLTIKNIKSLGDNYDSVFPSKSKELLLDVNKNDIKTSKEGIELGSSGIIFLPIPNADPAYPVKYKIYRVMWSCPPEEKVSDHYAISWTDKVFFIQIKDALRGHNVKWLAEHIRTPFWIENALGKNHYSATTHWIETHGEEIWYSPIKSIIAKTYQDQYMKKDLERSISENLLSVATQDLWANYQGVTADNGTIWYFGLEQSHKGNFEYRIISVNPVGTSVKK